MPVDVQTAPRTARGAPALAGRGLAPLPPRQARAVAPLAVDQPTAARMLSLSPRTIARLIASGKLRAVKLGGRVIIPVDGLQALISPDAAAA